MNSGGSRMVSACRPRGLWWAILVATIVCGRSWADSKSNYSNIRIFPSDTMYQFELSIAADPRNVARLLAGAITVDLRTCPDPVIPDCDYNQGYYVSSSFGASWAGSDALPGSGPPGESTDPAVVYDTSGSAYFAFIRLHPVRRLMLAKSPNGGGDWLENLTTVSAEFDEDKEHIAFDPVRNRLYIAWTDLFPSSGVGQDISFKRSVDGGATFVPPSPLKPSSDSCGLGCDGVNLAVSAGGDLYAVWLREVTFLGFTKSTDGGESFLVPRTITSVDRVANTGPPKSFRLNSFPSMAVDTNHTSLHFGAIYVVWADKRNGDPDILLIKSTNGGTNWSLPPIRVNQDTIGNGKDQWFPWINVDPYGGVNVVFYDCRNHTGNFLTEVFMARSTDGAATFQDFRVGDVQFSPDPIPNSSTGDYIGITSSSQYIYPCWNDNRESSQTLNTRIYQAFVAVIPIVQQNLPGHIYDSVVWQNTVYMPGDVVIEPTGTVVIAPGTRVVARQFQDIYKAGLDTGLVELTVRGRMILPASGDRPVFKGELGATGSWHGIRVDGLGQINSAGAYVQDAVNGLTLVAGATGGELTGWYLENCENAGIWTASDGVALVNNTIVGVTSGYGIYIDSANPVVEGCFIDSCEFGIYTFLSSATLRQNRIDGPGTYGIYVATGALYDDLDVLRLVKDTVYGYFSGAQLSVGWIDTCRVDSCAFISNPAGVRSPYGIKAGFGGRVRLRNSKILDFTATGFHSTGSASHLGRYKHEDPPMGDPGNNVIVADSTGCGACSLRRVAHLGPDTLRADLNWWGSDPPLTAWFTGRVDYTPSRETPPAGKVSAPLAADPNVIPTSFVLAQSYPNPFNAAATIEFTLSSSEDVRIDVFNILGQRVRSLVQSEFPPGKHQIVWDGTDATGNALASGIYLYRVTAGRHVETRKMVLMK